MKGKVLLLDPRDSIIQVKSKTMIRFTQRIRMCQQWTQAGNDILLCMQAPEIARGQWKEVDFVAHIHALAKEIGASYFYICCSLANAPLARYTDAQDTWRYPVGGMLRYALDQNNYHHAQALFVGTHPDQKAAAAAEKIAYQSASDFFKSFQSLPE